MRKRGRPDTIAETIRGRKYFSANKIDGEILEDVGMVATNDRLRQSAAVNGRGAGIRWQLYRDPDRWAPHYH